MWQTILNAFTFNENFAVRARAGLLQPSGFAERLKYAVDLLVTVLATPLVVVVSIPLELVSAMRGKGGVLVAMATQSSEEYEKVDQ
jgi:crotonobetainyl-CoA:carnitine CoA-transferase CaiB-like acyl-CoA transferase